jgi:hypothetical protein
MRVGEVEEGVKERVIAAAAPGISLCLCWFGCLSLCPWWGQIRLGPISLKTGQGEDTFLAPFPTFAFPQHDLWNFSSGATALRRVWLVE